MSPEQITAILTGVGGIIVAVTALVVQLRLIRKDLNGRLTQLIDTAALAAAKDGELKGRDFSRSRKRTPVRVADPVEPEVD